MAASSLDHVLSSLRAAGESTRLRILIVLSQGELAVGELCKVLGQTQPRVSRHLKLLVDAGLLERNAQGTSAFYRLARTGSGTEIARAILDLVDQTDPAVVGDLQRLDAIRTQRAEKADAYFEDIASDWDRMRNLHVADEDVEAAMVDAVGESTIQNLLDVGTGTGRVLEVFADRIDRGLGIDRSQRMLNLARSRLDNDGMRHCSVRQGDIYALDVEHGSTDVAIVHHVLHFLDDPAGAINEIGRTVRKGGRIVIVDFATHQIESMRNDYAHHWLGFDDDEVASWCEGAGFTDLTIEHLTPHSPSDDSLTVTIWSGTQSLEAPTRLHAKEAS